MKKAVIIYQSKTGTTENYSKEIEKYLKSSEINTQCIKLDDFDVSVLEGIDYLFLGCWTKGLMVVLQKPDDAWINFAEKISEKCPVKPVLFTTYKLRTGRMFKVMRKHLKIEKDKILHELKSRDGKLNEKNKQVISDYIF